MIDILIILLVPALKAVEGSSKNPLHWLAAIVAWVVDIVIAHTTWALIAGWPQRGEWTVSHTLERLCLEPSRDLSLYLSIARKINSVSPTGRHIKAVI